MWHAKTSGTVATLVAVVFPLLAGCGSGSVEVPAPSPDTAAAHRCAALHDRLPERVHGQSRRVTDPDSDFVAAWGSPAITLRCGVGRPAGLRPKSVLAVVNGISWFGEPEGRPTTFTALGRQVYIEVTVPSDYSPPGEALIDFAAPIKKAIPAKTDGSL